MGARLSAHMALAAVAVLVLAGCADASSAPDVPFGTHHVDKSLGGPAAEVRGTLVLVDGCLMVELEELTYPLVLPDVATWDDQAQAVTIDGATFSVGDDVWWGGAYGSAREEMNLPATCPTGPEMGVVYSTS